MQKRFEDDDGRIVADMSGIDRQGLLLPRRRRRENAEESEQPQPAFSAGERRTIVLGALSASALIGGIFIAAGALVIAFLLLIWR